jgi:hypothetical protein
MAKQGVDVTERAMESWLRPFQGMFTRPSWLNAVALASGVLLCLNRRTVCAALRAADGASDGGFCRFHRFLSRGAWSGLDGARVLLRVLIEAFAPDGPVVIGVDDTIERRRGAKIRETGIYRDPVRSSRGFFVKVEGLRWLSFQLLAKPCFSGRTWGLPFLTVLCPSERADATAGRRHRPLPEQAVRGLRLISRWLPGRWVVMVGDGGFACQDLFLSLGGKVICVARCRMDSRFFEPPPMRKRGQMGRPRVVGIRQPTPGERLADPATAWKRTTIAGWKTANGKADQEVEMATGTALWNRGGLTVPVRWILTRDRSGRAEPRVFVCSDLSRSATQILTWYAMRWAVEVTFEETRRHLGVETQRQWSDLSIRRATPLLLGLFSLVVLWACGLAQRIGRLPILGASWYKKPDPTFSDCLAAIRRVLWTEEATNPIMWRSDFPTWRSKPRATEKPTPLAERLAILVAWAA